MSTNGGAGGLRRRRSRRLALSVLGVALWTGSAAADIAPDNAKNVSVSYSFTNLGEHLDFTLIHWPRKCGSDGAPMGEVDLDLNPQFAAHLNDIDYEVVAPDRKHELGKFCSGSARLFALPAKDYPVAMSVAGEDDWTLGLSKGDRYGHVKSIDALTLPERINFFSKDPEVRRSKYRFSTIGYVRAPHPLKHAEDQLAIEKITETELVVVPKRVVYTYDDGATESFDYQGTKRPPPSKPFKKIYDDPEPAEAPEPSIEPPVVDHPQPTAPPSRALTVDRGAAARQRGRRPPIKTHVAGIAIAALLAVGVGTLILARRKP